MKALNGEHGGLHPLGCPTEVPNTHPVEALTPSSGVRSLPDLLTRPASLVNPNPGFGLLEAGPPAPGAGRGEEEVGVML